MGAQGITTPFHYVPLHSAPAGRRYGRASGELPVTDDTSARLVRLPMFWALGDDIERVIDVARTALRTPGSLRGH
jgi:dTDP-4-amino-4,6-dideoxygalactose transaminase